MRHRLGHVACLGFVLGLGVWGFAQDAPSYVRDPIRIEARVYDLTNVPAPAPGSMAPWSTTGAVPGARGIGFARPARYGFDPSGCLEAGLLTLPAIHLAADASATGHVGKPIRLEVDGPGAPVEVAFVTEKSAGSQVVVRHPLGAPALIALSAMRDDAGATRVDLTLNARIVARRETGADAATPHGLGTPLVHEHQLVATTTTSANDVTYIACLDSAALPRLTWLGGQEQQPPAQRESGNGLTSVVVVVRITGLGGQNATGTDDAQALPAAAREAQETLVSRLAELSALENARALRGDDALRLAELAAKSSARDEGEETAYRELLAGVRDAQRLLQRTRLTGTDGLADDEREVAAALDARDRSPDAPVSERLSELSAEVAQLQDTLRASLGDTSLYADRGLWRSNGSYSVGSPGHTIRETFSSDASAHGHYGPSQRDIVVAGAPAAGVAEPGLATYELGRSAALLDQMARLAQELDEKAAELSGEEAIRLLDELRQAIEKTRESLQAARDALLPTTPGAAVIHWELRPAQDTLEPFAGIGAAVGMGKGGLGGKERAVVRHVLPGGPAAAAGLRLGDAIVAVDGQGVGDIPIDELVGMIRGDEGTEVAITVERPGADGTLEKVDLTMTRAKVSFDTPPSPPR